MKDTLNPDFYNHLYGKYQKTDLLKQLETYQETRGEGWLPIGFSIDYQYHYPCRPVDSIPFAGTGGDGNHFCFLTDFGRIKDLSEAPIIMIIPMSDVQVRLVAKNLHDFLRLVLTIEDAENLDTNLANPIKIKRLINNTLDWRLENSQNDKRINAFKAFVQHELGVKPIRNVYGYLVDLQQKRLKEISIETIDEIGIIGEMPKMELRRFDYEINDPKEINKFLTTSTLSERLRFYREATLFYTLMQDYDEDILQVMVEHLRMDEYIYEAETLESMK